MRTLEGYLKDPAGNALANYTVTLVALSSQSNGLVVNSETSFNTDGTGFYSQSVLAGHYRVFQKAPAGRRENQGLIVVTDGVAKQPITELLNVGALDPIETQIAVTKIRDDLTANLDAHKTDKANPHAVVAGQVNIADAAGHFVATQVEAALAEEAQARKDHAARVDNPHAVKAAQVPIVDTANHFTAAEVEAALAEEAQARKDHAAASDPHNQYQLRSELSGWIYAAAYGVKADGVTDDAPALRNALAAGKYIYLPAGTIKLGSQVVLSSGHYLKGQGIDITKFLKTDFIGALFYALDKDNISGEDFTIEGPGQWIGTNNKGIELSRSLNEITIRHSFKRVKFTKLNDIALYCGTGAFCTWEDLQIRECGYAGVFLEGGDAHEVRNLSARNVIVGLLGRNVTGLWATGYNEQNGTGVWLDGCKDATLDFAVEANIDYGTENPGRSFRFSACTNVVAGALTSRQDTIGAAAAATAQHLLVDTGSVGVRIDTFRKVNSATYPPTTEAEVAAGSEATVEQHNVDPAKLTGSFKRSSLKSELDAEQQARIAGDAANDSFAVAMAIALG